MSVENLCQQAVIVANGQLRAVGNPSAMIQDYLKSNFALSNTSLAGRTDRRGNGVIRFTGYTLKSDNKTVKHFRCGEESVLEIIFEQNNFDQKTKYMEVGVGVDDYLGRRVALFSTDVSMNKTIELNETAHYIRLTIDKNQLMSGEYKFTLFARVNSDIADWVVDAGNFLVEFGDYYKSGKLPERRQGVFLPEYTIEVY